MDEAESEVKKAKIKIKITQKMKQFEKEEKWSPYAMQVLKMGGDYQETCFNLSQHSSNETIASIKTMTLGDRMRFQKYIQKNIKPVESAEV